MKCELTSWITIYGRDLLTLCQARFARLSPNATLTGSEARVITVGRAGWSVPSRYAEKMLRGGTHLQRHVGRGDGKDTFRRAQRTHHEPQLVSYHVPVQWMSPAKVLCGPPRSARPWGARGIGEIGITGVGAAVASAVYNVIGN